MERRTSLPLRIYRIFTLTYITGCAAMTAVYAIMGDMYHFAISACTLLVPPALRLAYRLLSLTRTPKMDMLILGFITLAYPLGGCVDLYRRLPGFDKLAHGLSGVFVTALCMILYMLLKPGLGLTAADAPLAAAFAFLGSMAVAGLWEVGEYIVSGVVKMDLQRVQATGIRDSMNDIIICLAGTLAALPAVPRVARGKSGLLASPIREFAAANSL